MFNFNRISPLIEERKSKDKKITVSKMCNEMGVSLDSLNKIKAGRNMPSIETVEKIAIYFGVDINYFLGDPKNGKYTTYKNNDLVASDSRPIYATENESDVNLWKLLYEKQEELTIKNEKISQLEQEINIIKKPIAIDRIADVG